MPDPNDFFNSINGFYRLQKRNFVRLNPQVLPFMAKSFIFEHIKLDDHSATPKYHQLANSIIDAIQAGKISKNDILPSINELSYEFEISRDTAEKGYKYLKNMGVLGSVPGKGYFIKSIEVDQQIKIFLLFNK